MWEQIFGLDIASAWCSLQNPGLVNGMGSDTVQEHAMRKTSLECFAKRKTSQRKRKTSQQCRIPEYMQCGIQAMHSVVTGKPLVSACLQYRKVINQTSIYLYLNRHQPRLSELRAATAGPGWTRVGKVYGLPFGYGYGIG